ncbi:MAG TPA: hypothetical protein VIK11_06735 [Tepidiformaceae bacterium]
MQPAKVFPVHGVTLAGSPLEPAAINDGHLPTVISDETFFLKRASRQCDARATDPQHLHEELLGDGERPIACPVMRHQQPASATFIHTVGTIARGRLSYENASIVPA